MCRLCILCSITYTEDDVSQKVLSVTETAARLGTHRNTVLLWIRQGEFPNAYPNNPNKDNSPLRIPETDVEAFEAKRQAASQS